MTAGSAVRGRTSRLAAAWQTLERSRARLSRPGSLIWTRNVNHRGGTLLALLFASTAATPNAMTVGALALNVAGAAFVAAHPGSFTLPAAIVVATVWQVAFCVDCADGQLARARGTSTAFGAWLDQVCDFVGHTAVLTALVVYLVRVLNLDAVAAVLLLAFAAGGNLLQLFTSSLRNSIIGTAPARQERGGDLVRVLAAGRHLSDWGGFMLLSALLLPLPHVLAGVVIAAACIAVLTVTGQVALNWSAAAAPGSEAES